MSLATPTIEAQASLRGAETAKYIFSYTPEEPGTLVVSGEVALDSGTINIEQIAASPNLKEVYVNYGGSQLKGTWKYEDPSKKPARLVISGSQSGDVSNTSILFEGSYTFANGTLVEFSKEARS